MLRLALYDRSKNEEVLVDPISVQDGDTQQTFNVRVTADMVDAALKRLDAK